MKNKQCSAYKFANDSFEFQESWFIWEAMLNIPLGVSSDTRTARKKTWPLLATCRVRFITWNTSKSVYLISKHWNWVSKRKKKTHERHNQGIKADFEVRVSDIQSSLATVTFVSFSSWTITMSMKKLQSKHHTKRCQYIWLNVCKPVSYTHLTLPTIYSV